MNGRSQFIVTLAQPFEYNFKLSTYSSPIARPKHFRDPTPHDERLHPKFRLDAILLLLSFFVYLYGLMICLLLIPSIEIYLPRSPLLESQPSCLLFNRCHMK